MASRKRNHLVAKLVTGKTIPCAFCNRNIDDELQYGKLYAIGNIQCHYYCVLLSSCLIQKGKDEHGLFGFLYEDILIEVERCKKHKCSYCNKIGANMGCSISQCRKQFHLPCGRERNSVSLFYGNYKTFCQNHAPKQKIPETIMANARSRKSRDNKIRKVSSFKNLKELSINDNSTEENIDPESVCVICYEHVEGYPTPNTFWPPCCARDAWFHRTCLQRMALSAGIHYLKCPLCNDKDNFYQAVIGQGYYVPDRDAAWELEQNAFSEIYERAISCSADECHCPHGRTHDDDNGEWSINLCMLCGSSGTHTGCSGKAQVHIHVCAVCEPAAPTDIQTLANTIEKVISQEQSVSSGRSRRGPIMPSRMSLRRTKIITTPIPSSSQGYKTNIDSQTSNTTSSREDLNIKPPKTLKYESITLTFSPTKQNNQQNTIKNTKYDSPSKILAESLEKKFGSQQIQMKDELLNELRKRFKKPQPLSVKRNIVNDILNGYFDNVLQESKVKTPVKQFNSPKKIIDDDVIEIPQPQETVDLTKEFFEPQLEPQNPILDNIFTTPKKHKTIDTLTDTSLEISAFNENINISMIKLENVEKPKKYGFFNNIENKNILDVESFKNQYLNEVSGVTDKQTKNGKLDDDNLDLSTENGSDRQTKLSDRQTKLTDKNTKLTDKRTKKRKLSEQIILDLNTENCLTDRRTDRDGDEIIVKLNEKKRKFKRKSISIKNKNIKVKIKWKEEQLKLHIDDISKNNEKKYKQYLLKYSPKVRPEVGESNCVLKRPEGDVTPIKRKKVKQEKTPDNLIQTSIQKFFKVSPCDGK